MTGLEDVGHGQSLIGRRPALPLGTLNGVALLNLVCIRITRKVVETLLDPPPAFVIQ